MPKGYWILSLSITDREGFGGYARRSDGPIAAHGGRFLVRAGAAEAVEGEAKALPVVIEFPDIGAARACYASEDYRAIVPLRRQAVDTDMVIAEGVG